MKTRSKKIAVQEKACQKAECKIPEDLSKANNLENLEKSGKLEEFVRKTNGSWDHQMWLDLCAEISLGGYEPIDLDQVGVLLEKHKAVYISK